MIFVFHTLATNLNTYTLDSAFINDRTSLYGIDNGKQNIY